MPKHSSEYIEAVVTSHSTKRHRSSRPAEWKVNTGASKYQWRNQDFRKGEGGANIFLRLQLVHCIARNFFDIMSDWLAR